MERKSVIRFWGKGKLSFVCNEMFCCLETWKAASLLCRTLGWTHLSNRLLTLEIWIELLNPEQFSYTLTSPPDLVPAFMFLEGNQSPFTLFFHLPQPISPPKIRNFTLLTLESVPCSPLMPHLILTQVYRCSPELPISTRSNLPASHADWVSPKQMWPWHTPA